MQVQKGMVEMEANFLNSQNALQVACELKKLDDNKRINMSVINCA